MESYRTVKQETSAEFIEKRSKFIGYIKPCLLYTSRETTESEQ